MSDCNRLVTVKAALEQFEAAEAAGHRMQAGIAEVRERFGDEAAELLRPAMEEFWRRLTLGLRSIREQAGR